MAFKSGGVRRWLLILLILVCIPGMMGVSQTYADISKMTVIENVSVTIDTTGVATVEMTDTISPVRYYDRVKRWHPNLYVWFREGDTEPANIEVNLGSRQIAYDDQQHSLNYHAIWSGYAVCRKERWEIQIDPAERMVTQEGTKIFTSYASSSDETNSVGTKIYVLPDKSQNIVFDKIHHLITYTTLPIPSSSDQPSLNVEVKYKLQLMAALYKCYADSKVQNGSGWVAKTVVRNTGTAPLYGLKITYKLGDYSEVNVPERYTQVVPGGTVIDLYYPLISARITELKTKTPVQLLVKYEYSDGNGRVYNEEIAQRLDILGINQFLWSNLNNDEMTDDWIDHFNNAPFVAAYVTRMDDSVKQFAGLVSQGSGGAGAALSDTNAVKWLAAAYNLELNNNIVYQTPSGYMTAQQGNVQEIKFPRDVFRDKSGTCIDLAITYAALAESVGLKSLLLLTPGHCFPIIILPSGKSCPVETTGLGGGRQRASFEQAVKIGQDELEKAEQQPYLLVDVESQLTEHGIANPELPPLPSDFLKNYQPLEPVSSDSTGNWGDYQKTLFYDDFQNRRNAWYTGNTATDNERYLNGHYEINVKVAENSDSILAPKFTLDSNCYTVQTIAEINGDGEYGIIFNSHGWDDPYYLFTVHPKTPSFSLWKKGEEWVKIVDWTPSDAINVSGRNTLQILQEGDNVKLYINNRFLTKAHIDSYAGDIKVGLRVESYDLPVTAKFTKFVVNTQ